MPEPRPMDIIYKEAPAAAVNRLLAFRERHPIQREEINGRMYGVHDIGSGNHAVVFLPGAMASGEMYFPFMFPLADYGRVIALSYPEVKDFETLSDDIATILRARGIESCAVIGQSIGGLIAQILVRRHPSLVQSMALLMTGAPAVDLPAPIRRKWASRWRRAYRFYFVPFNRISRALAVQLFNGFCPAEWRERMIFWENYFEDVFQEQVYRNQYLAINMFCVSKLYKKHRFKTSDMDGWNGKVTIMTSQGDIAFKGAETDCLKRLYPGAEVIDVGSEGQFTPQLHEREILEQFKSFLGYSK